ncbi:hypothetical protein AB0392_48895 [Nonomuraea angiospora]|uniref:hypothetical protein n=1 Tax=Nonomuraea angiospora TaxID=46172 RepID=UPI0034510F9E
MSPAKEIAVRAVVTFWNGLDKPPFELVLDRPLPTDTSDPRWAACTNHRVACDCREAVHAEDLAEARGDRDLLLGALREELVDHATRAYTADGGRDEQAECKCSGCRVARRLPFHIGGYVFTTRTSTDYTP